jgi:sortase A
MESHAGGKRSRRHLSVLGVSGEILLTAGALVVFFVVWSGFINPVVVGAGQQKAAAAQAERFNHEIARKKQGSTGADSESTPQPTATPQPTSEPQVPVSAEPTQVATPIAVIYVPRFGAGWKRVIREGVGDAQVLDSYDAGVGHYPGTAMPGGVGNFAIAAHDTGYGNSFLDVADLQLGDPIYIQTATGWYTYQFRNLQYVQPTAVDVIDPVPANPGLAPGDRLITLTTCDPPYNAQERTIAYGTFTSFSTTEPTALDASTP